MTSREKRSDFRMDISTLTGLHFQSHGAAVVKPAPSPTIPPRRLDSPSPVAAIPTHQPHYQLSRPFTMPTAEIDPFHSSSCCSTTYRAAPASNPRLEHKPHNHRLHHHIGVATTATATAAAASQAISWRPPRRPSLPPSHPHPARPSLPGSPVELRPPPPSPRRRVTRALPSALPLRGAIGAS